MIRSVTTSNPQMSGGIATDRALGALYGLAIGDALGMPTQELDPATARRVLGSPPDFRDAPADHPVAHGLPAGTVTDDTEQCLIIARLLIEGGGVIDPRALAQALAEWEHDMASHGRAALLGPSTKRALAGLAAGEDPSVTGRHGTTNGAAMRIAPVGIATPPRPLERLVAAVVAAGQVTHNTDVAHAGAAAVAAVISAGVEGETFAQATSAAVAAAGRFGHARMIEKALAVEHVDEIVERIGTGVETDESVPAAFAVARLNQDDAWRACAEAAALGGDADTIAAIAGAMLGACTGLSALPPAAVGKVREVNDLLLEPVVEGLLALRWR